MQDDIEIKKEDNKINDSSTDVNYFFDRNNSEINDDLANMYYKSEAMITDMVADSTGNLYFLKGNDSGNTFYEAVLKDETISSYYDEYCRCLCLDEESNVFYTYNYSDKRIEIRNKKFEYVKTVIDGFDPFEVKKIIAIDNKLYVLVVFQNPFEMQENAYIDNPDEYVDYGEKLLKISLEDGKKEYLDINNIITMCESDSRYIYLYSYRNDSYRIEVYDTVSEKIVYSIETEELGYIFSIAVSGEDIFYVSNTSNGLCRYNIKTKETRCLIQGVIVAGQCDFDIHGRYLIVEDRSDWTIRALDLISGKISKGNGTSVDGYKDAEVLIAASDIYNFIPAPLKDISDSSGIQINTMVSPDYDYIGFNEELMVQLMSGNPEVDIFILSTTEPYSQKISNDGVCYPLNGSETILNDNNAFFDNISSKFRTAGGNIWGIPLNSYMEVMVASPKNMENRGISTDIFKDYTCFMDEMKRLDNRDGIYVNGYDYGFALTSNYITNNHTDFKSLLFRHFFETMWTGWNYNESMHFSNNPYLGEITDNTITVYDNKALIDPDTTLFHLVAANELLNNEGWSDEFDIYGLPLLDENDKQCISLYQVAVINPNSKNKENAVKVLETISDYLRDNGKLGVVYKDRSRYSSVIDTDSKLFNSLYDLTKDALVTVHGITNDVMMNEVESYKNGDIDLDTAISSIQRKEDIYLYE
ncbi:MAG: hypothetical protein IKW90_01320 [Lachnospiraceae bacterium]|nr:hypothetical protein [Lachnospiraceae bacterium]